MKNKNIKGAIRLPSIGEKPKKLTKRHRAEIEKMAKENMANGFSEQSAWHYAAAVFYHMHPEFGIVV